MNSTAYGLHWIRVTLPYDLYLEGIIPAQLVTLKEHEVKLYGHHGYNRHSVTPCGSLYWHETDRRQKIMLDVQGEACEEIVRRGYDHMTLLKHLHDLGGVIKRLDFAADYFGESSPYDLLDDYDAGTLKTRARGIPDHKGRHKQRDGVTVQLGETTSNRYIRCYDRIAALTTKGKKLPDGLDFWTRVELQANDGYAPNLGQAMREYGIVQAGKRAMRDYIKETAIEWLKTLLEGDDGAYIDPVGRKETDPYMWYKNTVIPMLRGYIAGSEPSLGLDLIADLENIIRDHKHRLKEDLVSQHFSHKDPFDPY